jgi:DNA-binding NtrC family response regulator
VTVPTILVVDDDPASLKLFRNVLTQSGYEVVTVDNGREALRLLADHVFAAAILDIMMPDMNGIDLLREIRQRDPNLEVVMTTAYPEVDTAVRALREGAHDYLQKPLDLDELRHRMSLVMERRYLRGEVGALRARLGEHLALKEIVGSSPPMVRLKGLVARVAPSSSPVLIEGESGTGKELVAAAIHRLSPRQQMPFIPVNCGAIPPDLLESEFFGHVRGAFSGAHADALGLLRSADTGTLFLDEISELPLALQTKLLRVLQDMEVRPVGTTKTVRVDVRIIAATNRRLEDEIKRGTFREDLFYRLNVVRVAIPPLRERRADIPALATSFIRQFNERFGRDVRQLAPDAIGLLMAHDFPGNVRELENLIERAYALGATRQLGAADFATLGPRPGEPAAATPVTDGDEPLPTIEAMERELIQRALRRYPNDREKAARALGMSPRTLFRRLKEFGLR